MSAARFSGVGIPSSEQLSAWTNELAELCRMAWIAMDSATRALMQADLVLAEDVIGHHEEFLAAGDRLEQSAMKMTLSTTIFGELPSLLGSNQIVAEAERMGTLALHVAEMVRRRHPQRVVPEAVGGYFAEMGRLAVDLGRRASHVILSRDPEEATFIRSEDDSMDDLHRHLFTVVLNREWDYGVTAAVDVTLLGRFYERFADHAVEISRRVTFQVSGKTSA